MHFHPEHFFVQDPTTLARASRCLLIASVLVSCSSNFRSLGRNVCFLQRQPEWLQSYPRSGQFGGSIHVRTETYAVVTARVLSEARFNTKTNTKAKSTVNSNTSPSRTKRSSTKKSMIIRRTGNMLETVVTIDLFSLALAEPEKLWSSSSGCLPRLRKLSR